MNDDCVSKSKVNKKPGVMPIFYWGDVLWLKYFLDYQGIIKFSLKQTYRKQRNFNRTYILGGNGIDILTIPVSYQGMFPKVDEVKICYNEDWQKQHVKKIYYAYKNSAYFEYHWDSLEKIYKQKPTYLWEFNKLVIEWLQFELNLPNFEFTTDYVPEYRFAYRLEETPEINFPVYFQLFTKRFFPNLSTIDIIMNLGMESKTYLKNIYLINNEIRN
jgi:hypothetical protein